MWANEQDLASATLSATVAHLPRELCALVAQYARNVWHDYFTDMGCTMYGEVRFTLHLDRPNQSLESGMRLFVAGRSFEGVITWPELWQFITGGPVTQRLINCLANWPMPAGAIDQMRCQIREQVAGYCVRRECADLARSRRKIESDAR